MHNKAFIFDMDGVLIDSERAWITYGNNFLEELLGKEIAKKIGDNIGMSINTEYALAVQYGFRMDKEEFLQKYEEKAQYIYSIASLTDNVDMLIKKLSISGFRLGLVSSSPMSWITQVLKKMHDGENLFTTIISLNDNPQIKPKPSPDGYILALQELNSEPKNTIILEDSNTGIQAAKASGAFTIGFRGNLIPGYQQAGADAYAQSMNDVLKIVDDWEKNHD